MIKMISECINEWDGVFTVLYGMTCMYIYDKSMVYSVGVSSVCI